MKVFFLIFIFYLFQVFIVFTYVKISDYKNYKIIKKYITYFQDLSNFSTQVLNSISHDHALLS